VRVTHKEEMMRMEMSRRVTNLSMLLLAGTLCFQKTSLRPWVWWNRVLMSISSQKVLRKRFRSSGTMVKGLPQEEEGHKKILLTVRGQTMPLNLLRKSWMAWSLPKTRSWYLSSSSIYRS
jgi:hypothetical protein